MDDIEFQRVPMILCPRVAEDYPSALPGLRSPRGVAGLTGCWPPASKARPVQKRPGPLPGMIASDMAAKLQIMADWAKRIKATEEEVNSIQYGKLRMAAYVGESCPVTPRNGTGRGKKLSDANRELFHADTLTTYRKLARHQAEEVFVVVGNCRFFGFRKLFRFPNFLQKHRYGIVINFDLFGNRLLCPAGQPQVEQRCRTASRWNA